VGRRRQAAAAAGGGRGWEVTKGRLFSQRCPSKDSQAEYSVMTLRGAVEMQRSYAIEKRKTTFKNEKTPEAQRRELRR
jgi:acetyl-CoA carboxylase carboxyltransferase component